MTKRTSSAVDNRLDGSWEYTRRDVTLSSKLFSDEEGLALSIDIPKDWRSEEFGLGGTTFIKPSTSGEKEALIIELADLRAEGFATIEESLSDNAAEKAQESLRREGLESATVMARKVDEGVYALRSDITLPNGEKRTVFVTSVANPTDESRPIKIALSVLSSHVNDLIPVFIKVVGSIQ